MAFRFLHLADLHLETSFGGRPETRARLRAATREAFERAIDYAIEHRLHAVLAAGDLFDDAALSLWTQAWFARQVERLARAGPWFVAVCGNHDPGAPHHKTAQLGIEAGDDEPWRRRVRFLRRPEPEPVCVLDGDGRPVGLVVGAGHDADDVSANLAAAFPRPAEALPAVALLHTHVASASAGEGHERYAPSTAADYRRDDYGYWALGHIHKRQQAVPGRPVYYAGNLQGRNPSETDAKGGLRVDLDRDAPAAPAFVRFGPVRWGRVEVSDLPDSRSAAALVEHLKRRVEAERRSPGEEIALRLVLAGTSPLARELRDPRQRRDIEDELEVLTGALEVQLRAERLARPFDRQALRDSPTVVASALRLMEAAATDDPVLDAIAPSELAAGGLTPDEQRAYLRDLLDGLSEELVDRSVLADGP